MAHLLVTFVGILLVVGIGMYFSVDPAHVRQREQAERRRWTPHFVAVLAAFWTLSAVFNTMSSRYGSGGGWSPGSWRVWLNAGIWWFLAWLLSYEKRTGHPLWKQRDSRHEQKEPESGDPEVP